MLLSDLFDSIRRRWYLLLVGLVATAGLSVVAVQATPPLHTARGLILLLPPPETVGEGGNPLLAMDGLGLPASIVVAYFSSASAQEEVAEVAPDATYSVAIEESTRGPLIAITATAPSPSDALKTLVYLSSEVPDNLARLQDEVNAPVRATVTSTVLAMDSRTEKDASDTTRIGIAVAVLGAVASLLLTSLVDGWLVRRKRRRGSRGAAGEPGDTESEAPTSGLAEPEPAGPVTAEPEGTAPEGTEAEPTAAPPDELQPAAAGWRPGEPGRGGSGAPAATNGADRPRKAGGRRPSGRRRPR